VQPFYQAEEQKHSRGAPVQEDSAMLSGSNSQEQSEQPSITTTKQVKSSLLTKHRQKIDFALIRIKTDMQEFHKQQTPTDYCDTTISELQVSQSPGALGSLCIFIKVSSECPSNYHYKGYSFTFEYCIFPKYPYTAPQVFLRVFDQ
jgi:hypothetical protein